MSINSSGEQIKFIFIKNYQLRSIEILLSRNCPVSGSLFAYDFKIFLGQFQHKNTHNHACGIDMSNNYSLEQIKFLFIIGFRVKEVPLKYILPTHVEGRDGCSVTISLNFQVGYHNTILIVMSATLWNKLNLYLSRIIGFGDQEIPLKYFLS